MSSWAEVGLMRMHDGNNPEFCDWPYWRHLERTRAEQAEEMRRRREHQQRTIARLTGKPASPTL